MEGLGSLRLLLLLLGYLLLLQDFPRRHPDSLLQGAQKGCLAGLGCLDLLLLLEVLIPLRLFFLPMRTGELWGVVALVWLSAW